MLDEHDQLSELVRPCYDDGFGWRVWYLNDAGRLRSIFVRRAEYWDDGAGRVEPVLPALDGRDSRGPYVEAQCPHQNQVPSAACACGVHYIPTLDHCLDWLASVESRRQREGPWALTFGVADGATAVDASPPLAPFEVRRVRRYYPRGIAIPESHAPMVDSVREYYAVEVVTLTDNDTLRSLERSQRTSVRTRVTYEEPRPLMDRFHEALARGEAQRTLTRSTGLWQARACR